MSTSKKTTNAKEDEVRNDSPLNNVASVMAQSIEGMQNTLGTVYSTMATNLRQSLEMTQTMNSVMEHFLRISVRTKTVIIDEEGKPRLFLTISNNSQMPVSKVICHIEFKPREGAEETPFDLEHIKSSSYLISQNSSMAKSMTPIFDSSLASKLDSELITLEPFSAVSIELLLTPPEFSQYIVTVRVDFPSPGTGKLLSTHHEFGLYLVHQCKKEFLNDCELEGSSTKVNVPLSPLRKLFKLNPTQGIPLGAGFRFQSNDIVITLIVKEFEKEFTHATCEVNTLSNEDEHTVMSYLNNMVEELSKLYLVEIHE
ncbi:hypothetical protein K7432_001396 [Basidiobolus ranarum]|uniref:Uncharacterized protein n=1 Tax=Basidiobolus ranarum TaxID=34480 RepID=A0ABR2W9P9_9FUNG